MKSKIMFLFDMLQSLNIHAKMNRQKKTSYHKRISKTSTVAVYSFSQYNNEFFDHSKTN